ncbi:hypothetical protein RESH_04165 [Rhodopirellula europaea SH398]|uniref:Uncharacterized protein n=1 Tax=Rhodopirellula europaea SH398 TaxID=1263868 RepID=M5SGJ3_9BACT|nr:hypothetical protein RESH_04165 [Rhodopirellula europaea SH398]
MFAWLAAVVEQHDANGLTWTRLQPGFAIEGCSTEQLRTTALL